jgi:hypothetical protein
MSHIRNDFFRTQSRAALLDVTTKHFINTAETVKAQSASLPNGMQQPVINGLSLGLNARDSIPFVLDAEETALVDFGISYEGSSYDDCDFEGIHKDGGSTVSSKSPTEGEYDVDIFNNLRKSEVGEFSRRR